MADVYLNLVTKNERKLGRVLLKQEKQIDKLNKKLKDSGKTGKSSFKNIEDGALNAVKAITGIGGVVGAATLAVTELKKEFDAFVRRARETSHMKLTIGQARNIGLANLPSDYEKGVGQYDKDMKQIAKDTGVNLKDVYRMSAGPLSTKGAKSRNAFVSAMELAMGQYGATGGNIDAEALASSLISLSDITGQKDAKNNFGWLLKARAQGNISSDAGMVKQIKGIVSARTMGDTSEQAIERRMIMSKLLVDTTGENTAESASTYETSLKNKKIIPTITRKGGKKKIEWGLAKGENTTAREKIFIEAYQQASEDLQAEMMIKFGEQKGAQTYLRSLIAGDKNVLASRKHIEKAIQAPSSKDFIATDDLISQQQSTDFGKAVQFNQKQKAFLEGERLRKERRKQGTSQTNLDFFMESLEARGVSSFERGILSMQYQGRSWLTGKPIGDLVAENVGNAQKLIDQGENSVKYGGEAAGLANIYRQDPQSLSNLVDALERNTKALKENKTSITPSPQGQDVD